MAQSSNENRRMYKNGNERRQKKNIFKIKIMN